MPSRLDHLERARPVLEVMPGWKTPTTRLLSEAELPEAARSYVSFLERQVGAPVVMISTGPRREETILRTESPVLGRLTNGKLAAVVAAQGTVPHNV